MKLIPMVESSKKGFTWPDPAVLEAVHKHIAQRTTGQIEVRDVFDF